MSDKLYSNSSYRKPKKLNLAPTNFIIADSALKLTNIDLSTADAAVSNKVTLTFSLSIANLSRYTDTADSYVVKYSNIYTNQYIGFTNLAKMSENDMMQLPNHPIQDTEFDFIGMTNATTNETILILENSKEYNENSKVDTQKFIGTVSNRMYNNSIGNFTNYYNSFKFVSFDTNDSESIANFQIDFKGKWDNNLEQ